MLSFIKKNFTRKTKRRILPLLVYPAIWYYKIAHGLRIYVRQHTSDINVFYHTFLEKEYALPFVIKNPRVIIDAGANIGLTALMYALKYPEARIIAIEPESSNYAMLQKNTRSRKNITTLNNGLWSSDAYLKIENPEAENWGFITREVGETDDYDLKGTSVDAIREGFSIDEIDIFKIDIEGSEREVFSKNEEKWLPKTKWIVLELHEMEGCEETVRSAMEKYGFKEMHINGENRYYANKKLVSV